MKTTIGQQIALLRRQKGVTQEQVARAVGVSAPAVSKWEAGQSCPDIALLMPLARYFGVTVDRLLGYQEQLSRAEADQLAKDCRAAFEKQGWGPGLAQCRSAARQYPQDAYLKYRLASAVQMSALYAGSEAEWAEGTAQQEEWLEAGLGQEELDHVCRYLLGCLYAGREEYGRAEKMLEGLPEAALDGRQLLPSIYLGQGKVQQAERAAQQNMLAGLSQVQNALLARLGAAKQQEDWPLYQTLLNTMERLTALFGMESYYNISILNCALSLAVMQGDWEEVIALVGRLAGEMDRRPAVPPLFDLVEFADPQATDPASPQRQAIRQGLARGYEAAAWAREHLAGNPAWQQALAALWGPA